MLGLVPSLMANPIIVHKYLQQHPVSARFTLQEDLKYLLPYSDDLSGSPLILADLTQKI